MAIQILSTPANGPAATYQEAYRPQLSYSPARNWMNDPNGLVYHEGNYHLFYQYNPNGDVWGDMSWGHAVSPDLLHWSEQAVALTVEKDGQGAISQSFYSGSAVVDHANSSGLGLPGQAPVVAIYTSVYPQAATLANGKQVQEGQQSQSLAYSLDGGASWVQHAGNPVLELPPEPCRDAYRDFRDPKVFWYAPERKWVMVVVLALRHQALLYSSTDLLHWEFMSEFGPAGGTGGVWECPDLFALPVDGDAAASKWVLVINLNPGGPAGGSGAQYFIGHFDGKRFVADGQSRWLDFGPDFYAAVSWNDVPDGRRILIGWMSNWQYANKVPTTPWRSAQSVPRELALRTLDGQLRLVQRPLEGFERLRGALLLGLDRQALAEGVTTLASGAPLDIELLLVPGSAAHAGLQLHVGANGDRTVVAYDCQRGEVYVDRSNSGDAAFSAAFSARHAAPQALRDGALRLRILVDRASVTVFAGAGETVLTCQVFPGAGSDGIALFAEGGQASVRALKIWALTSIWAK
ncbi:MAG: glycoside hydrolase family 32 protein [Pseudomonadota bacterium]